MGFSDIPPECQQLILEKVTDIATKRNIHQVSRQWHDLAASSRVICRQLRLPPLYDTRTPWEDVVRWTRKRAGLLGVLDLYTVPRSGQVNLQSQFIAEESNRHLSEEMFLEVLRYAASSVHELRIWDLSNLYHLKVSLASLLGPAMPLFSNLRDVHAQWEGDGLQRTHLDCLQHAPLLEFICVMYHGANVDLGPHFPEGLLKLRKLQHLSLSLIFYTTTNNPLTSFCTLPEGLSQLSALNYLSLGRYFDHIETKALLHLTSLRDLTLVENPTKYLSRVEDPWKWRADVDWVHHLPVSLKDLRVTGDESMMDGRPLLAERSIMPVFTVPCITGLTQLTSAAFEHIRGLRHHEWGARSCLALLTNLRNLKLCSCGLDKVSEAVIGLPRLIRLFLGGNQLKDLPVGLYLHHLESLDLPNNQFSSVPVEAVVAATALTHLAIDANPLVWNAAQAKAVKHIKDCQW